MPYTPVPRKNLDQEFDTLIYHMALRGESMKEILLLQEVQVIVRNLRDEMSRLDEVIQIYRSEKI